MRLGGCRTSPAAPLLGPFRRRLRFRRNRGPLRRRLRGCRLDRRRRGGLLCQHGRRGDGRQEWHRRRSDNRVRLFVATGDGGECDAAAAEDQQAESGQQDGVGASPYATLSAYTSESPCCPAMRSTGCGSTTSERAAGPGAPAPWFGYRLRPLRLAREVDGECPRSRGIRRGIGDCGHL